MKTIIIIFLLIISCLDNSYSSEIESETNVSISNDSLIFEIQIKNNSSQDLYILLDNWTIEGNETNNFFISFPRKGYLVNSFWYYPKNYEGVMYRTERFNYPDYNFMPTLKCINPDDVFILRVSVKTYLFACDKYKYLIYLPYFRNHIVDIFKDDDFVLFKDSKAIINFDQKNDLNKHIINYFSNRSNKRQFDPKVLQQSVSGFIKTECEITK